MTILRRPGKGKVHAAKVEVVKPAHKPPPPPPPAKPKPQPPAAKAKVATPWKGSTMQPCSACQGSGRRIMHAVTGADVDYGPCPVCHGTGEIPEESPAPSAPAAEESSSPTSSSPHRSDQEDESPAAEPAGTHTYGG